MGKGLIIKLPNKGNLKECKNWMGIPLFSVVGKILGWIVIDRLQNGVDIRLRNEQSGYCRFSCDVTMFQNLKLPFLLRF